MTRPGIEHRSPGPMTDTLPTGPGLAVRVFANDPGDLGSIPCRVIPKIQKIVLDASLLNTQHYKVRIKGKVEQSRERSSALPYTLVQQGTSGGVMVSKLDQQTYTSEFESHWVPHSFGLVLNRSKELRKLLHLGVVAIEKGAFGSPSTMVANFTYLLTQISFI